jgi:hypothetical protein
MIGTFYSDIEYSIPFTIENKPHNAGSIVVTWPETTLGRNHERKLAARFSKEHDIRKLPKWFRSNDHLAFFSSISPEMACILILNTVGILIKCAYNKYACPQWAERPGRIVIVLGFQTLPGSLCDSHVQIQVNTARHSIPINVTPHTWECQDPKSFLHFSAKLPKTDLTPLDNGTLRTLVNGQRQRNG